MELRLEQGPLDEARLGAISLLYGEYNAKYRDPRFCRSLFNDNPRGYSLHAFLIDDGGAVAGHYAAIPMDVLAGGRRRLSGKGEAFVVRADQRAASVIVEGSEPMAAGLALPFFLYRFALAHGMELVHMIADPEVGLIHRLTGCHSLTVEHRRARLFLRRGRGGVRGAPPARTIVSAALEGGQRLLFDLARSLAGAGSGEVSTYSGVQLTPEILARVAGDVPEVDGWTLCVDSPMLAWLARSGDLRLIALGRAMEDYAVVCPRAGDGGAMEVLLWRQRSDGLEPALRLLSAVAAEARRLGDAMVGVSEGAAWRPDERARLTTAARRLFFRTVTQGSNMYVCTNDPYYRQPANLRFTPLFYGVY